MIQSFPDITDYILRNEIREINQEKIKNRFCNYQSNQQIDMLHQLCFIFQLNNVYIDNIFSKNRSVSGNDCQKN